MPFLKHLTQPAEFNISTGWPRPACFPEGWMLDDEYPDVKREYKVLPGSEGPGKGGKVVFVRGHLMSDLMNVEPGDELDVSFYVKDPDKKDISFLLYAYSPDCGKEENHGMIDYLSMRDAAILKCFEKQPGAEWALVSGKFKIPGEDSCRAEWGREPVNAVKAVLASDTGAFFAYPAISHIRINEWRNPGCARLEGGGRLKMARFDYAGARELFRSALDLAETEDERKIILDQIEAAGRAGKINETCRKGDEIFFRADGLKREGKYEEARGEYEAMKKLSADDYLKEMALFNIAELYRLQKDYVNAHRTYNELLSLSEVTDACRLQVLLMEAEAYSEQEKYESARRACQDILSLREINYAGSLRARLKLGDVLRKERKYIEARGIFESVEHTAVTMDPPQEHFRAEAMDRLKLIEGLKEGQPELPVSEERTRWINKPAAELYVSPAGDDDNAGMKECPVKTLDRARDIVRQMKRDKKFPENGIAVYLRGGGYEMKNTFLLTEEDSGAPQGPVVFRSYPGEEAVLRGGRQLCGFSAVKDRSILNRLPESARESVFRVDLKQLGITEYGQLFPRGYGDLYQCDASPVKGQPYPSAAELFYNGERMRLARWPDEGWARTGETNLPGAQVSSRSDRVINPEGKFQYEGDRPERWLEEDDVWLKGYWTNPYAQHHSKVVAIDTEEKTMTIARGDQPQAVGSDFPYFAYNILAELNSPGEWYLDRKTGILYFWPPGEIDGSDVWLSTLAYPVIELRNASGIVLHDLAIEGTWEYGVKVNGGGKNLISKSIVRNTGKAGVLIEGGNDNSVIGCDIYQTGDGGVILEADKSRIKQSKGGEFYFSENLEPAGHLVENCHIHHFNQVGGGYGAGVYMGGVGNRTSRNLIHDGPSQAVHCRGNDHVIEYNEVYDVIYEPRDVGVFYFQESGRSITGYRGNLVRFNFLHHIGPHYLSPQRIRDGVIGIYLDGVIPAGITSYGNIFYQFGDRSIYNGGGRDCRFENNLFVECETAIDQIDRRSFLKRERFQKLWEKNISEVLKHEKWRERFPQLIKAAEEEPKGLPVNNVYERNVFIAVNTNWLKLPPGFQDIIETCSIADNWTDINGNPCLEGFGKMKPGLRTGSPVYSITGFEPLPVESIGPYEDDLRAGWPLEKNRPGKYWNTGEKQKTDG